MYVTPRKIVLNSPFNSSIENVSTTLLNEIMQRTWDFAIYE